MFYSEFVLAKKGPLGQVWLAAHWSKKLTRGQISKSNVVELCNSITEPAVPLALRTSGHLLLGLVRIHDKKQKGLWDDCSDALVKIKLAFRPGVVDLPANATHASLAAITLPESFDAFESELPMLDFGNLPTSSAVINIGRQEDITLQDSHLMQEDLEPEGMRMRVDDFGGDNVMGDIPFYLPGRQDVEAARAGDDLDQSYRPLDEPTIELSPRPPSPDFATKGFSLDDSRRGGAEEDITMQPPEMDFPEGPVVDLDMPRTPQTNFSNHAEVEPLSPAPAVRGLKISRRKRKLVVDERTEIPGEDIRRGLQPDGPNDITRAPYTPNLTRLTFELGPPTKKAMLCRETMTQSVESQLSIPRQSSWAPRLREHFQASLVYHSSFTDAAAAEAAVKENEDLLAFLPEDHPEMPVQPEMEYPEQQIDYDQQEREYHMEPDTTLNDTTIGGAAEAPLYDVLPNLDEEDTGTRQVSAEEFGRIAWSKRTKLMLASFKTSFEEDPAPKQYSVLTAGKSRRSAAACLFELLVLKTKDFIEVEQLEPFADITITATDNLFNCDPAVAMEMDVLLPTQ